MATDYSDRQRKNEQSKTTADHDREEWTGLEDEVVLLWSGEETELDDLAEMLGRTREAVRQRFYVVRRLIRRGQYVVTETKTIKVTTETTTERRFAWQDDPENQWLRP